MRACFLGQNICALGFGVATLQAPPLVMDRARLEPVNRASWHGLGRSVTMPRRCCGPCSPRSKSATASARSGNTLIAGTLA